MKFWMWIYFLRFGLTLCLVARFGAARSAGAAMPLGQKRSGTLGPGADVCVYTSFVTGLIEQLKTACRLNPCPPLSAPPWLTRFCKSGGCLTLCLVARFGAARSAGAAMILGQKRSGTLGPGTDLYFMTFPPF